MVPSEQAQKPKAIQKRTGMPVSCWGVSFIASLRSHMAPKLVWVHKTVGCGTHRTCAFYPSDPAMTMERFSIAGLRMSTFHLATEVSSPSTPLPPSNFCLHDCGGPRDVSAVASAEGGSIGHCQLCGGQMTEPHADSWNWLYSGTALCPMSLCYNGRW